MSAQVISFNCVLKNRTGNVISSTFSNDVLTGPCDANVMLGSLAKGLQNLSKGEKRQISLKAEEAYGLYFPQKVIFFPKRKLPATVRVGETIAITGNDGLIRTYKVLEFYKNMVSLDGNHPLAGQDLVFEIETLEVRDATLEEIGESTNPISSQIWH